MRVITSKSVRAFFNRQPMSCANMRVYNEDGCTRMLLHRNRIAEMDAAGIVRISTAGWNTRTTLDRLNGILRKLNHGSVYTRKFELHLCGAPWSGEWTVVYDPAVVAAARYAAREVALASLTVEADKVDAARAAREVEAASYAFVSSKWKNNSL